MIKEFPERGTWCRLTKVEANNPLSQVRSGDSCSGGLSFVVLEDDSFRVQVATTSRWLMTSRVMSILDKTQTSLRFVTEGGVYFLEYDET